MHRHVGLILLITALGAARTAPAQEALVLSGGGSRGLAHVGALLAIDSLHRDPDLVVGVSMGAVVGSLYAAGYSAEEVRDIATRQNWRDLFKPVPLVLGPDRAVQSPGLHWAVDLGRFEFSRGLMPDWRINRTLVHLLFEPGARARGDFDRLPRRYRPLAADDETGEAVILARGDLALAVRASMAESGFFSPVRWHDRILIDGGIADYLPVALARTEGGAPVIAVDVLRSERPTGTDPISMLRYALTLLITRARDNHAAPDVLVEPKVDPAQAGFAYPDDVMPMIRLGEAATLRVVPPATSSEPPTRTPASLPDSLRRLVIVSPDSSLHFLARSVFRGVAPAPTSVRDVLRAVDRMYASGFTESVWPHVDSTDALIVQIDPRANLTLDIAPAYDNDRGGRIWVAAQRRVGTPGAPMEFELAGAATGTDRWASLSIRRLLLSFAPLSWGASAYWHESDARFVRVNDDVISEEVTRTGGWLGVEWRHIFPDYILSATAHGEHVTVADSAWGSSFGPQMRFSTPSPPLVVGEPWLFEAGMRFGDVEYNHAALRGSLRSDHHALKFAWVVDAAVVDKSAPADVRPALGDDRAMPGLRWGEERGRARVVTGFDVAYPLLLGGHLRMRGRVGAAPLRLEGFEDSGNWLLGGEVAGIWMLPFANILIGGGFTSRGNSRFDVVIGSVF